MTTTNQTSTNAKAHDQATKVKTAGRAKAASRKTASPAHRTTRAASRRRMSHPSAFEGYSDSAARLIARGRSMLGDAYAWAGEAGSALPRTARTIGERTMRAASIIRPSCSSAVPCALSNMVEVGQIERMPISMSMFSSSARARTRRRLSGSRT